MVETLTAQALPTIPTALVTSTVWSHPIVEWTATSIPTSPISSPSLVPTFYYYYTSEDDSCENSSAFISDVTIPDDSVLAPGEYFVKSWRFYNTGTWNDDYAIAFVDGANLGVEIKNIDHTVDPGGYINVSVLMRAPYWPGIYLGYWRLVDGDGNFFDDYVYVRIVVTDFTATPTSTVSPTSTVTPPPTIAPIDTPIPTASPTESPTETPTPPPIETEPPEETRTP